MTSNFRKEGAVVVLAELTIGFQWSILLVADSGTKEDIPDWASADEQVTAADSTLAIRVRHEQEGDVAVNVVDDSQAPEGLCVYSGYLEIPTRRLIVGDAVGEHSTSVALERDRPKVEIFLNEPVEATQVTVLIGK